MNTREHGAQVSPSPNLISINSLSDGMTDPSFIEHYPELQLHWEQLLTRAQVYARLDSYRHYTKSWLFNKNTHWHFNEIQRGMEALKNLASLEEHREEIEWEIRRALDAELSFLELRQYRKLSKDQDIYWPEIRAMEDSLKLKIDYLRDELRRKKLSAKIFQPGLQAFFKRQEQFYCDFDNTILRAQGVGDVVGLLSSSIMIIRFSPSTLLKSVDKRILFAIPSIAAIVEAVPILLGAVRTWVENRSIKKKMLDTTIAAIVSAGIAVAISIPMTVLIISSTFVCLGVLKDYMVPLYQLFSAIHTRKKELGNLAGERGKLETISKTSAHLIKVDARDKSALLRQLEWYCVTKKNVAPEKILAARALIETRDVALEQLSQNELIKSATSSRNVDKLKEFIQDKAEEHKQRLTDEINALRSQRVKKIALAVNGLATIVGSAFFCIPTPLTLLIGATIYAATSAVTIIVKYDFVPKAMRFFSELFGREQEDEKTLVKKDTAFRSNPAMRNLHRHMHGGRWEENKKSITEPAEVDKAATSLVQSADEIANLAKIPLLRM